MIEVTHNGTLTFKDYNQLLKYITYIENLKLFENHPEFGTSQWSFEIYKPERVKLLYENLPQSRKTPLLKAAYEGELGMVMLCEGDFQNPWQVPLAPGVRLEALIEDWCHDYADENGWVIQDTQETQSQCSSAQNESEQARKAHTSTPFTRFAEHH